MFDTSCSCSREKVVAIGVEFDTFAMGRGSWLAQSADYEWTLTHVAANHRTLIYRLELVNKRPQIVGPCEKK